MIDVETARQYYEESDPAHGFDHVLRVWKLARRIGLEEGADMEILRAAVLLHDIGRAAETRSGECHAQAGARMARQILSGYSRERVDRVVQAIAQHRFRGEQEPNSLEAKVLYDADKLDALGAVGVARAYAIAGLCHQRLWARVDASYQHRRPSAGREDLRAAEHTPVHEYSFKLARLEKRMYTGTGKRLARERHRYMAAFFERLEREVDGQI